MENPLVLFDGVCNLCNSSVQFIIKNDPAGYFKFAPLQSEKGQEILKRFNMKTDDYDTFILYKNGQIYTRSTGVLHVLKHFNNYYRFFYFFIIIPSFIRDYLYNFVAGNRYRFFGRKDACMIPTPELKARFIN